MNWEQIETVAAVVHTQSLLAAAKQLGLRHTSVSRRISAIEAELGEPLFLRGRRLRPTAIAREIEARAADMAIAARQLEASLSARRAQRGAEIVITTSDALAPLLLRALSQCGDQAKIRLVVTDEERELEPGTIDIALRPTGAPLRALRGRRLGTLAIGIYQRKATPAAKDSWVLACEDMRKRTTLRWLRAAPDQARVAIECDRLLAMRDACAAGLGRAILPCYLALDDPRLEQVTALDDGIPIWLFVAIASQSEHLHRSFIEALARALKAEKRTWRSATPIK